MTEPTANGSVDITPVDGTTLWMWVRHYTFTVLKPGLDGLHGDETEEVVHSLPCPITFPDRTNALGHARAVNADLAEDAFVIGA